MFVVNSHHESRKVVEDGNEQSLLVEVVEVAEEEGETVSPNTTTKSLREALQSALDLLDSEEKPGTDIFRISLEMQGKRFSVGNDFPDVNFTLDVPDPEGERLIRYRIEAPRAELIQQMHGRSVQIWRVTDNGDVFETTSRLNWETDNEGRKKPILVARFAFLNPGSNYHIRP